MRHIKDGLAILLVFGLFFGTLWAGSYYMTLSAQMKQDEPTLDFPYKPVLATVYWVYPSPYKLTPVSDTIQKLVDTPGAEGVEIHFKAGFYYWDKTVKLSGKKSFIGDKGNGPWTHVLLGTAYMVKFPKKGLCECNVSYFDIDRYKMLEYDFLQEEYK